VLEASGMTDIDYTGAGVLREVVATLRARGLTVALARLGSTRAETAARRLGVLAAFGQGAVFPSVAQAVDAFEAARRVS